MIKEYIDNALPTIDSNVAKDGLRGAIHTCMIASMLSWTSTSSTRPDGTLRGLVDYCVNIYFSRLSDADVTKRKNTIKGVTATTSITTTPEKSTASSRISTKSDKIRLKGTLTVTGIVPPSGQLENGKIISFSTVHELAIGDKWPYTYNAITGIYTVYTNSRGKVEPCPRRVLEDIQLSEQFGKQVFTQAPSLTSADSIVVLDTARIMLNTSEDVIYRLQDNLACYVKNKIYTEFKTERVGDPPVETTIVVKTVDLSSYMPTTSTERLTIGKFLVFDTIVCILYFTDKGFPTTYGADDDIDLGRAYNLRSGQATIKGELLLLDRTTWAVVKAISSVATVAAEQLRFTGVIDMIKDELTGELVLAKLSETSHTVTATYDTARMFVAAADRTPHSGVADVTQYTVSSWYAWLSQERNIRGFPAKAHVIKEGTKSWSLNFPLLTITRYPIIPSTTTTAAELGIATPIYTDLGTTISSIYDIDCFGGYTNCMLYQDPFDAKKPIYIGRCYDAWTQIPLISDDYTIVPGVGPWGNFRADTGKYLCSPLPGEVAGFFGVAYHKILTTTSLELMADVPGDAGVVRSFLRDDLPGHHVSLSGATVTSDITLLAIADYVVSPLITKIRENCVSNTFSSGPGSSDIDYPVVRHSVAGFQDVYAVGLHTHSTRFAVLCAPDTPTVKRILAAGSFEYQSNVYNSGESAHNYSSRNMTTAASTGLYLVGEFDLDLLYYPVYDVGTNWQAFFRDTSGITDPAWQPYIHKRVDNYTVVVTRSDIQLLDASTFYNILSVYQRQYDWFDMNGTIYISGLVWWMASREIWQYKGATWKGVIADISVNLDGDFRQGAETIQLQYY